MAGRRRFRRLRRWWIVAAGSLAAVLAGWLRLAGPAGDELPEPCHEVGFEDAPYIVCELPADTYRIGLRLRDETGQPFGSLKSLASQETFLLAMNAGMYHKDLSPVGLYMEDGKELGPLNRDEGEGNFFLEPNGVFFIDKAGKPGVLETEAFAAAQPDVLFATQSGPMLVIDGNIHPKFQPDGASRFVRNGVGVTERETAVLAVSRTPVSLGAFARLFRDGLGCRNALFFDGAVSALHDDKKYLVGGEHPAGPILVVTPRVAPAA